MHVQQSIMKLSQNKIPPNSCLIDEVLLPEDAGDGQDVADLPQVHCAVVVELQR